MSARWEQFYFRAATSERGSESGSGSGTRICRSNASSSSSAFSSSPDSSSEATRSSFEFCPTKADRTTRTTFRRFNLNNTNATSKQRANRATTTKGLGFHWLNPSKHQAQAASHCDPATTSRPSSGGSFLSFSGSVCSSTSSCSSSSASPTWMTATLLKHGRDSAELANGRLTSSYLNASREPQDLKSPPPDRRSFKLDSSPAPRARNQVLSQAQSINLKSKAGAASDNYGKLSAAQLQQAANNNSNRPSEASPSTTAHRERSHSLLGHLIDHYLTAKRPTSHSAGESYLIQSLRSTGFAAPTTAATQQHKQTSDINRFLQLGASNQHKSKGARLRSERPADRKGLGSFAAAFVNLSGGNKRPSGSRKRAATCSAASSAAFCSASHSSGGGLLDGSVLCLVRRELSNFFKSF